MGGVCGMRDRGEREVGKVKEGECFEGLGQKYRGIILCDNSHPLFSQDRFA
jgi:hypothetical protein